MKETECSVPRDYQQRAPVPAESSWAPQRARTGTRGLGLAWRSGMLNQVSRAHCSLVKGKALDRKHRESGRLLNFSGEKSQENALILKGEYDLRNPSPDFIYKCKDPERFIFLILDSDAVDSKTHR